MTRKSKITVLSPSKKPEKVGNPENGLNTRETALKNQDNVLKKSGNEINISDHGLKNLENGMNTRSNWLKTPDKTPDNGLKATKLLAGLCVGHLLLSVVTSTTIGIYISEHAKEIETLKQETGILHSSNEALLLKAGNGALYDPAFSHDETGQTLGSRIDALEADMNQHKGDFLNHSERVDQLEANLINMTNQSQSQELITRVETLETVMKQHQGDANNYSKRVGIIEAILANETNGTFTSDILATPDETPVSSRVNTLNDTVRLIEEKLDQHNEMTQEGLEDCTARITELETDRNYQRKDIDQLAKEVSELNETLKQLETVNMLQNDGVSTDEEATSQLYNTRLLELESYQMMSNDTLAHLQTSQLIDREMILNNTFRVLRLESVSDNHTSSVELENNVIQLGKDVNEIKSDIVDSKGKINVLEQNITDVMTFYDDQSQRHDELESAITALQETINDYKTVEKITGIEYSRLVDTVMNELQNDRILDLEFATARNEHTVQIHTSTLADLTDALNCAWGNWSEFSTCTHSCGGGIKYRTRSCQNTNPLREDWLPRSATEIEQCNTQNCIDVISAFTATYPVSGATFGTIKFTSFVTNIGSHYDLTSGVFTCVHPGTYVFHLSIFKASGYNQAYCNIRKNGVNKIYVDTNVPNNPNDFDGSSNTVVLHLNRDETVDIGDCSGIQTIHTQWETSFSGYLLKGD